MHTNTIFHDLTSLISRHEFDELQNKYKDMLKKVYELQLGIGLKKADGISKVGEISKYWLIEDLSLKLVRNYMLV